MSAQTYLRSVLLGVIPLTSAQMGVGRALPSVRLGVRVSRQ